jgi:assimilatory nitrate reductase catalytic subunit
MDSLTLTATATHCPYCALQCGMLLQQDEAGAWAVAARDFPTNKGGLCRKGWTAAELLNRDDRLRSPLLRERRDSPLRPVSWDVALDHVAGRIQKIQAAHGRDAVALFGGGGLTNEKAYLLGKFARVGLRTANIDYNGRFCMASSAAAGSRAFGIDRGMPFPLADLAAADAILLMGGNPAETMPPFMQYLEAQRAAGGRLIVADPRRTATAQAGDLHLQLAPGTDAALALGLLHVVLQQGFADEDYIAARTTGFAAVRRIAASYWPDRVERITGVPARKIVEAAGILGRAARAAGGRVILLSGRGPEQQQHGVDNAQAGINLALALGLPGRAGCGWGTLTGQGNGQGGREHGQKADQLPGYRKLANPADRAAVAAVWGVDPDSLPQPGLSAVELLHSIGTKDQRAVHALLVFASNIAVSAPGSRQVAELLAKLDLLVVADCFMSETAVLADVVLPVTQWAEEDGTMTNLEGRVLRRRRALSPPPGVRSDTEVITGLAERLGAADKFTADPRAIFEELRRASAGGLADYAGITWDRIEAEDGVFWPCPDAHPGTPRLFADGFATDDGRARFFPVEHRGWAEATDGDYPFVLTTGRVLAQYQTGTQTRRVESLVEASPAPFVEVHPATARTLHITQGEQVRVVTRRGDCLAAVHLSADARMDTLFVPFHWGGDGAANNLTNPVLDPTSRMPEFKVCAARIEKLSGETKP